MSRNVADLLVETLVTCGVQRIFGVVGDSLNEITEALRSAGTIEWVHMRNEEAAAFAACGEAQATGALAVCAGACGPGNLHLINGLSDAHRTRVPVLAIAAQVPSAEIGSNYFQETHPEQLFRECSHYCELVSSASQMPRTLDTAIRAAVGANGVSVIVMPGDIALQPAKARATPRKGLLPSRGALYPSQADVEALTTLLDAERVTLFCGRGCAGMHAQVLALAEALKAPVVHALGGKEHVEWDNPYDVGMTGLIGFPSGYHAMMDADVLLMLGTDFLVPPVLSREREDRPGRPENLGRRCRLDLGSSPMSGRQSSGCCPASNPSPIARISTTA